MYILTTMKKVFPFQVTHQFLTQKLHLNRKLRSSMLVTDVWIGLITLALFSSLPKVLLAYVC